MDSERITEYLKQDKPLPRLIGFTLLWGPITIVWVMYIFHPGAIVPAVLLSLLYLSGYLWHLKEKTPDNMLLRAYFGFWKYLFLAIEGLINLFGAVLAGLITLAVVGGIIGLLYFGWKQLI